jgi:hypothetical protein
MLHSFLRRAFILSGTCLYLFGNNAFALIKSAEGRNELSVTGTLATGYDSNINSAHEGKSDIITSTTLAVDFARNAGLIAVNGELSWTRADFAENAEESFSDPSLNLEFIKIKGRATGSIKLSAARESQADPTLNQRTVSWNYNTAFNWKYPVIDRYSLGGTLSHGLVDYTGPTTALTDLTTKSASADLFYKYNSQRELLAGYRIRQSDTSANNQSIDHAITTGVSGKILAKLKGEIRAGYQLRQDDSSGQSFGSTTASAAVTWAINRRFNLTATVDKDFSTTANESSVDNLSFNLDARYALTYQWALFTGLGTGQSQFLNGTELDRSDYYATWRTGTSYTLNQHLRISLNYSFFVNQSNRSTSSFDRNTLTLNLSSRW